MDVRQKERRTERRKEITFFNGWFSKTDVSKFDRFSGYFPFRWWCTRTSLGRGLVVWPCWWQIVTSTRFGKGPELLAIFGWRLRWRLSQTLFSKWVCRRNKKIACEVSKTDVFTPNGQKSPKQMETLRWDDLVFHIVNYSDCTFRFSQAGQ